MHIVKIIPFSLLVLLLIACSKPPTVDNFLSRGISTNYACYLPLLNRITNEAPNLRFGISNGSNPYIRLLQSGKGTWQTLWEGNLKKLNMEKQTVKTDIVKYWYNICTNWNIHGFSNEGWWDTNDSCEIKLDVDIRLVFVFDNAFPMTIQKYENWATKGRDLRGDICVKLAFNVYLKTLHW